MQRFGLISSYFTSNSKFNQVWNIAGIAVRMAASLVMNLRNDSASLKDSLKEIRYRVWWALYTLEHRLYSMTERLNCIPDDHCTTPLPAPLEENPFDSKGGTRLLGKEQQRGARAPESNSYSSSLVDSSASLSERFPSVRKASGSPSSSEIIQESNLHFVKDVTASPSLYFLHLALLTRLIQYAFQQLYSPSNVHRAWFEIQWYNYLT